MLAPKSQTTKFALKLAAIISIMAIFLAVILYYGLSLKADQWLWLVFGLGLFVSVFFLVRDQVQRLIYRQIKKIYQDAGA